MTERQRLVVGIPARLGSTRFPGKPLCDIDGMTMIEHCLHRAALAQGVDEVFAAVCDDEVKAVVENAGFRAIMTDPSISRPGLRVAVAARELDLEDDDIVVVAQGDEPLIQPKMIELAVHPLHEDDSLFVSNMAATATQEDLEDPGEIKVVCDLKMNALYMTRAAIPSSFHEEEKCDWFKQVCIMPFRWHFMRMFNEVLSETPLELQESIEMNRAIQHGYRVRMVFSDITSKSVDTERDRVIAQEMMRSDDLYRVYYGKFD